MTTIQEHINADGVRYAETNIRTEEWLQMLTDGIIGQRQIEVLLCFYREPEHQGICKVLAKKYGQARVCLDCKAGIVQGIRVIPLSRTIKLL